MSPATQPCVEPFAACPCIVVREAAGSPSVTEHFHFADLREMFAKANEQKSGDELAGIAARSERERVAAKFAVADLPLSEIVAHPIIEDDVTALIQDAWSERDFSPVASLTVGEFRELILEESTTESDLRDLRWAITPEIAAAVTKIMSNRDLVTAAAKIRNVTRCRNTLGER